MANVITGVIPVTLMTAPSAIDVDEDNHAHINSWTNLSGSPPPLPWTFSHDIGEGAATEAMINLCLLAHFTSASVTLELQGSKITKVTIQ